MEAAKGRQEPQAVGTAQRRIMREQDAQGLSVDTLE